MFVIGRKRGSDTEMQIAFVDVDEDSVLDLGQLDLRVTTIRNRGVASVRQVPGMSGRSEDSEEAWIVLRYDVLDEGRTLRVLGMNEETVAADVRDNAVRGEVKDQALPYGTETLRIVVLTETTTALRDYLAVRGDEIYRKDRPLLLRRLVVK
jgi:hypothetical protein